MSAKQRVEEVFAQADIILNGKRPWDIQVHNEKFYSRVLSGGSLALGESYMEGWWDCQELDECFRIIQEHNLGKNVKITPSIAFLYTKSLILNQQTKRKARVVGERHYDIGNDLYQAMLDPTMAYSCGYWRNAKNLSEAQIAKYEIICKKLGLKKGMRVLDIGCGWGGFLIYAAKKYKISGVGVTISKEQAKLAKERAKGLPVEIRIQDYRNITEKFDCIVSVGMFEHVGYKNYKQYFTVARRCLKDDGLFLLHTIGGNKTVKSTDPWIEKYIFPNSMLPSVAQISKSIEHKFLLEDWHSFGAYYDKTLMSWEANFRKSWPKLKHNYDEKFYRMWRYYLLACAGGFRARKIQLWQLVLSKNGVVGGYERPFV